MITGDLRDKGGRKRSNRKGAEENSDPWKREDRGERERRRRRGRGTLIGRESEEREVRDTNALGMFPSSSDN